MPRLLRKTHLAGRMALRTNLSAVQAFSAFYCMVQIRYAYAAGKGKNPRLPYTEFVAAVPDVGKVAILVELIARVPRLFYLRVTQVQPPDQEGIVLVEVVDIDRPSWS